MAIKDVERPNHLLVDFDELEDKGDQGRFYDLATDNLYSEKFDTNLWSVCLAHTEMDENRAAAAYLRQMASWMEDYYYDYKDYLERERIEKENKKKREEEKLRAAEREKEEEIRKAEEERQETEELARLMRINEESMPSLTPLNGFFVFSILGFFALISLGYSWGVFLILLSITSGFGAVSSYCARCVLVPQFGKLEKLKHGEGIFKTGLLISALLFLIIFVFVM